MAEQPSVDIGVIVALIDSISKENSALISALGIKNMTSNPSGDGILMTMSDDTQYDIPLSNLPYLKSTDISDLITSDNSSTIASSKAIYTVVQLLNNYITKTSISDSIVSASSTTVASSKAVYDINQFKVNKTDIENTIVNNPSKVASSASVYSLQQEVITDYIPKINITDSYTGVSKELVLSQFGAEALKDLILAGVSGMQYVSAIDTVSFLAMDAWSRGDVYKSSEEIIFNETTTIPKNALIIFKDTSSGTISINDFDYFASEADSSTLFDYTLLTTNYTIVEMGKNYGIAPTTTGMTITIPNGVLIGKTFTITSVNANAETMPVTIKFPSLKGVINDSFIFDSNFAEFKFVNIGNDNWIPIAVTV